MPGDRLTGCGGIIRPGHAESGGAAATQNPPVPFPVILIVCGDPKALLVMVRAPVTGALPGGLKLIVTARSSFGLRVPVNASHLKGPPDAGNDIVTGFSEPLWIDSGRVVTVPVGTTPNNSEVGLNVNVRH